MKRRSLACLLALLTVLLLVGYQPAPERAAAASPDISQGIPVYAYFYQWYSTTSWQRAKQDYPLAGRYSSDDARVLRNQVKAARAAGIDGFLTSWKSTPTLNRRLQLLIDVSRTEAFDLGIVYEALDFQRNPLPIATVRADLVLLASHYAQNLQSQFDKPIVVWTGIDQYSTADVASVAQALNGRVLLLASAKNVKEYERVAASVAGDAYYWSSADPRSSTVEPKLADLSRAVHAHGGLWLAPAAPGYDGRLLGGHRVIDRRGGETLKQSFHHALNSAPDAVGVISWNEWSENTYIEPSERFKDRELVVLRSLLAPTLPGGPGQDSSDDTGKSPWTGARAAIALVLLCAISVFALSKIRARRRPAGVHRREDRELTSTPPGSSS